MGCGWVDVYTKRLAVMFIVTLATKQQNVLHFLVFLSSCPLFCFLPIYFLGNSLRSGVKG